MLKKIVLIVSIFSVPAFLTSFTTPEKQQIIKTIIIDAGHGMNSSGGYDGAKGTFSYEDEIALAVSKKLVKLVSQYFPDIRIVETRPTQYKVDNRERANIANRNRGDLFISIHVNAMPPIQHKELTGYKTVVEYIGKGKKKKKRTRKVPQYHYYTTPNTNAKGTQTYIWGSHKSEDKEVAIRENAPMLAEDNYQEKYGDLDPSSPEFIALSLAKTKQFTMRSATLAGMVEDQFAKIGRISGGKKQRQVGIWVLQATAMPSVLVETGFITNPDEERYLNSESGQQEIANSVALALKDYIAWLEKKQIHSNPTSLRLPASNSKVSHSFLNDIEAVERKKLIGRP